MSATDKPFHDSSGVNPSQNQKSNKPSALQLQDSPRRSLNRDSGCFADSPFSAASNSTASSATPKHFVFDSNISSPSLMSSPSSTEPFQQKDVSESTSLPRIGDVSTVKQDDSLLSDAEVDDDDADDVFHMSYEDNAFLDSGIQEPSHTSTLLSYSRSAAGTDGVTRRIRDPSFYIGASGGADNTQDEEDSSTEEEYSTAEFELQGSPSSTPINIPQRSQPCQNSSDNDYNVADGPGFSRRLGHEDGGNTRTHQTQRPIIRHRVDLTRPHSDYGGRAHGVGRQDRFYSQSIDGSTGPLPDLVQHEMRSRAYSESSLYTTQLAENLGRSLRDISDEFAVTHLHRRTNLNMLQQLHAGNVTNVTQPQQRATYASSYPQSRAATTTRRKSFLSSVHEKFFAH